MPTARILTVSFIFSLFFIFLTALPKSASAEGTAFPCNRPNQLGIGVPTNNYQCGYTSNNCRNTAYTHYSYTTDNNNDGSADPNDQYDQPWCDYSCSGPANVACQSSSGSSGGSGQTTNPPPANTGGSAPSSGGSCTDPGGNSLASSVSSSDQTCIINSKGAGLLGSVSGLLNSNGYNASGCTQGQLLTKWCNDIDQSGCQQAKASCGGSSSSTNSNTNTNSGGNTNSANNSANNSSSNTPGSNTVTTKVGNPNTTGGSSGNCGKYNLSNPLGNFGDPGCSFTQDDLYQLLKQNDPANADYWYLTVIPCESGYSPNAYNPLAVSSTGAWGLEQMGRGENGQYDHGDVVWQTQTTNAITYNNNLSHHWRYWACASNRW